MGKDHPNSQAPELEVAFKTQRVLKSLVWVSASWGEEKSCSDSLRFVRGALTRDEGTG